MGPVARILAPRHAIVPPAMEFEPDPYRPVSRRGRVLIVVLTLATAAFITYSMTRRWGIVQHAAPPTPAAPAVANCAPGQTSNCVGSMTSVIAVPPATPASR